MIVVDKQKAPLWSRRLHLAVRAYQELLMTLSAMDKYGSESVRKSSRVLKGNIFYVPEYREMCLVLLQNYKEVKHSIDYLKDLVETAHVFLKLFEDYSKSNGRIIVQKKTKVLTKRKKKSKSAGKSKASETPEVNESPTSLTSFEDVAHDISAALQERPALPDEHVPFDAASDLSMDDQK